MSRKLRIEYPRAMYHIMNRGTSARMGENEVDRRALADGHLDLRFQLAE
jgi:hypothetical protein